MNTNANKINQTVDIAASTVSSESDVTTVAGPEKSSDEKVTLEEFKISGDALVAKIKELVHQGNIRRIIINNEEGQTLIEIPMTVGVIGGVISAVFFPVLAAVGAIGTMVAHLTIVIERQDPSSTSESEND